MKEIKWTEEKIRKMDEEIKAGKSTKEIAEKYKIGAIYLSKMRKKYGFVQDPQKKGAQAKAPKQRRVIALPETETPNKVMVIVGSPTAVIEAAKGLL